VRRPSCPRNRTALLHSPVNDPVRVADPALWPEDIHPARSPIHTHNALDIAAPVERVWAVLLRAADWHEFYANCKDLRFEGEPGPSLGAGSIFTWRTFGLRVRTTVTHFEAQRILAWRGDTWYGRGCHLWALAPTQTGCRLITEEVQAGLVPWLGRFFLRRGLHKWHDRWLAGIAARARE
jgi:hypothetical protein